MNTYVRMPDRQISVYYKEISNKLGIPIDKITKVPFAEARNTYFEITRKFYTPFGLNQLKEKLLNKIETIYERRSA